MLRLSIIQTEDNAQSPDPKKPSPSSSKSGVPIPRVDLDAIKKFEEMGHLPPIGGNASNNLGFDLNGK